MLRPSLIALAALAALGSATLLPTVAAAYPIFHGPHFGQFPHFHGARFGISFYAPVYVGVLSASPTDALWLALEHRLRLTANRNGSSLAGRSRCPDPRGCCGCDVKPATMANNLKKDLKVARRA